MVMTAGDSSSISVREVFWRKKKLEKSKMQ
jgi:hypothetical protein